MLYVPLPGCLRGRALFFIIVAGLFWKRSVRAAMAVVICSWVVNCAWSIGPLKAALVDLMPRLGGLENAHISAAVAFFMTLLLFGLTKGGEPALFRQQINAYGADGAGL